MTLINNFFDYTFNLKAIKINYIYYTLDKISRWTSGIKRLANCYKYLIYFILIILSWRIIRPQQEIGILKIKLKSQPKFLLKNHHGFCRLLDLFFALIDHFLRPAKRKILPRASKLLERGANINAYNYFGRVSTALITAAVHRNKEIMVFLLKGVLI